MKTLEELNDWCLGAFQEFGDPSVPVAQIFARFVPRLPQMINSDIIAAYEKETILLSLEPGTVWPLSIDADGPIVDEQTGQLVAFGIEQITTGLWSLRPSFNVPGLIHAFVNIYDVPAAAPWESRIIVVSAIGR